MADSAENKSSRSQADKERSRQQSRSVNARDAARPGTTGGRGPRPPKGGRGTGGGGRNGSTTKSGAAGRGPGGRRPQSGQRTTASPRGGRPVRRPVATGGSRSATALLTWGIVAVVLVVILVLLGLKLFGGSPTTSSNAVKPGPVPSSVVNDVTHVPASVFDAVGITSSAVTVKPPSVQSNQPPYTVGGKPGLFFMGGEYCPFCAAERWSVVAALSRFGTISNLETMASAPTDLAPNTQTFTFVHAKFKSQYLAAVLREVYSNQKTSTGRTYQTLQSLTKAQSKLVQRYDVTSTTASSNSRSIPFMDVGNKVIFSGASFSPMILQGLSRQQIATNLSDPKNAVTQAIVATANYLSAGICSVDGGQPAAVCHSKGVQAAAKALKLSI